MPITLENFDAAFTYHPWNEDQVAKGKPIRAAAKAAAKALLEFQKSVCDLHSAIDASAPSPSDESKSDLARAARDRRKASLDMVEHWIEQEERVQQIIGGLGQIVMIANAAITFEAAELQPMDPAEAHSERENPPQPEIPKLIAMDTSIIVEPADEPESKDERPQVTE